MLICASGIGAPFLLLPTALSIAPPPASLALWARVLATSPVHDPRGLLLPIGAEI
jgi:hypothetical protein